jgi:hypothetical protein
MGLRPHHFQDWHHIDELPWLEILADNLMGHEGGPALWHTDRLAARTPVVLHGVGLNIGSVDPLDQAYLQELKRLQERYQPSVISDHLCLTRAAGISTYELLPLPRTEESLVHCAERIDQVQQSLGQRLTLENVSAYVEYEMAEMSEAEFFTELTTRTQCGMLLDLNNLYVNAVNFNQRLLDEFESMPWGAVTQIHLAGHTQQTTYLFDTHDQPVCDPVMDLMRLAWLTKPIADVPVVLEWDDPETPLADVRCELARIRQAVIAGDERDVSPANILRERISDHDNLC